MTTATRTAHWVPVTRARPCEACGKPDYCTRSADGEVVKCMRVPSAKVVRNRDMGEGYIHQVADLGQPAVPVKAQRQQKPKMKPAEIEALLKRNRGAISPRALAAAAAQLRVSEGALRAYGIGYDPDRDKLSFPMFDGLGKPIGIHLRARDGKKICVPGSRNGLFIPADYDDAPLPEGLVADGSGPLLLLTPEGLTDCCAARDAGFRAIGRPSNSGGAALLVELLSRNGAGRQDVVVMGEREDKSCEACDETGIAGDGAKCAVCNGVGTVPLHFLPDGTPYWPGIEGPLSILRQLLAAGVCGTLRFAMPPKGYGKDLREWLTHRIDATAELSAAVRLAKPVNANVLGDYERRIAQRKAQERRGPEAAATSGGPDDAAHAL